MLHTIWPEVFISLKDTSEDPNKDHNIIYCQHILTRGKNKGSCCLKKPMIGYTYCKQHKGKNLIL